MAESENEAPAKVRAPLMPSARQRLAPVQPLERTGVDETSLLEVKIMRAWGPPQILVASPEQGVLHWPEGITVLRLTEEEQ